ncbi:MAG: bifunctional riboflavin kinase/FAD synthetase [Gammaproteobacteria bacterium]
MRLIRGDLNQDLLPDGCALTIGNFDGVHLGHQAVIAELIGAARRLAVPAVLMTFEPLPREYFAPQQTPARLTRLREKVLALADLGLDYLYCQRFNGAFADQHADDFIRDILLDRLRVRHLVVGDDFRFGHNREGDFAKLQSVGEKHGFAVERMPTYPLDGERISSTRVRDALVSGRLDQAARLLGRPYALSGRVMHGDKRGRSIGFPTANLSLGRRCTPVHGVFAVRVRGAAPAPRFGVANIGRRPTVGGERELLEVHLLDYEGDLYGRCLQVELLARLREEMRFPSLDDLKRQIARDIENAHGFFSEHEIRT